MSWYYVDKDGNTQGPKQLGEMQQCFLSGKLATQSFVWNGADVNQWTPLQKVPKLLKSCQDFKKQKQQTSKPPTGGPSRPRRKNPFGGGGRSALLGAIQRGAKLRKAPKVQEKKVGQPAPKKPGQKLSLREQMALTLRNRRNKSMGGNRGGNKPKPKSTPSPVKSPVKKPNPTSSWKSRQQNKTNTSTTSSWKSRQQNKNNTSNNSSTGNSRIDNITKKLKNAQEWQLKAIEKLLS